MCAGGGAKGAKLSRVQSAERRRKAVSLFQEHRRKDPTRSEWAICKAIAPDLEVSPRQVQRYIADAA